MLCRNTQAECGERGACGNLGPLMLKGEAKILLTTRTDTVSVTTYHAKHCLLTAVRASRRLFAFSLILYCPIY